MSAIFFTSSVSKRSLRSFSRATGTISLSVNSRAVSRIRRCSSVNSKSIKSFSPYGRRQAAGFSTMVARPWPTPMHIVANP